MQRRRKGIHRTYRLKRTRSNRRTRRNTQRSHRSKRIICNHKKQNRRTGGNYDIDVTTQTRELVPMKSEGVVVAMPGYVLSVKDYQKHMENMDFHGSD